ncbi:hypothetical protein [Bradyrhizobium sp.]|uniref:hypothetical protein n=1 Tax=Bradyrhizobium sp. TaxID=376 RepID=UPI002DFB6024|nr:hypothetical protein [Bradyrhizobium sp.]
MNEKHHVQHPHDTRHEVVLASLQEIRNELARVSHRLTSRSQILSHGARDAYQQVPRRLVGPLADDPDTLEVVLAHFIPQRLKEEIAFYQIVTMLYLKAHGGDPMLAKNAGHLYAEAHGFFNRRASTHLVTQANIEGDVFWVPDPANHQIGLPWCSTLRASRRQTCGLESSPKRKGSSQLSILARSSC